MNPMEPTTPGMCGGTRMFIPSTAEGSAPSALHRRPIVIREIGASDRIRTDDIQIHNLAL